MSIRYATYYNQGRASKTCLFVLKFLCYYKTLLLLLLLLLTTTHFYNKLPRNRKMLYKALPTSWWNLILLTASQMCS